MRKAVKSSNPVNAEINRHFRINVSRWIGTKTVTIKGKEVEVDRYSRTKITSANKLSELIDEQTKTRLFAKALRYEADQHTVLIRKRLKIKIYLK